MKELPVILNDNIDISTWDFSTIKVELQAFLSDYDGLVYTDETIKDAKTDRATLNKAKKVVEDAKKAYKSRCLQPYKEIEPLINELTGLIEERWLPIDKIVKEFEGRQKEAKEKKIRKYFDEASGNFGENADQIWQKIFDPKWTNATTSEAKYRDAIQIAIASVSRDMESIKDLNSRFENTLTEVYLDTLSMDNVLQKKEELEMAAEKAGLMDSIKVETAAVSKGKPEEMPQANEDEGTLLRIYASQKELNQVCDFMKAIGVTYEIV